MTKYLLPAIFFCAFSASIVSAAVLGDSVGIGVSTPHASAALEISSTTKGFLPPRMTSAQAVAIASPAEGLIVYCTDCVPKGWFGWDGTSWEQLNN